MNVRVRLGSWCVLVAVTALVGAPSARATPYFWDSNDDTAGTWSATTLGTTTEGWSTSSAGTATANGNRVATGTLHELPVGWGRQLVGSAQ